MKADVTPNWNQEGSLVSLETVIYSYDKKTLGCKMIFICNKDTKIRLQITLKKRKLRIRWPVLKRGRYKLIKDTERERSFHCLPLLKKENVNGGILVFSNRKCEHILRELRRAKNKAVTVEERQR